MRTYCSVLYDGGSVVVCVDSCEDLVYYVVMAVLLCVCVDSCEDCVMMVVLLCVCVDSCEDCVMMVVLLCVCGQL